MSADAKVLAVKVRLLDDGDVARIANLYSLRLSAAGIVLALANGDAAVVGYVLDTMLHADEIIEREYDKSMRTAGYEWLTAADLLHGVARTKNAAIGAAVRLQIARVLHQTKEED